MVFSSHLFLFYFLPIALVLYYLSPRVIRHLLLTLVSYIFYGWANPLFIPLLLFSTVVDYFCGLALGKVDAPFRIDQVNKPGTLYVLISVVTNLSLLGYFKYAGLFGGSYDWLSQSFFDVDSGLEQVLRVTLPLGISFYTFQSMSYTIDVYRGHARSVSNFIDFACYVSLFPQLVAGPIVRFSEVADQLQSRTHTSEKFARGAAMLSLGLGKKVLLANPCGWVADQCFNAESITTLQAWWGALAYSFQIYFDFSGYSDMAIGLGLMMGFVFPKNFNSPYRSRSITEFWRRWHISLSSWLRDYLYIPLGGNKKGASRTYINLMLVMLLGGLWHGATSWNFVIWGGIHGLLLISERAVHKCWPNRVKLPGTLAMPLTFLAVVLAWVFFRADGFTAATDYLAAMFGLATVRTEALLLDGMVFQPMYVVTMIAAAAITWLGVQSWDFTRKLTWWRVLIVLLILWLVIPMLFAQAYNPFIYFIF